MEQGQIIKVVGNKSRRGDIAYRKFELGERRLYKVLRKITYPWEQTVVYKCCLVSPVGRRIGSWEYYLEAADVVLHNNVARPLEDWM